MDGDDNDEHQVMKIPWEGRPLFHSNFTLTKVNFE